MENSVKEEIRKVVLQHLESKGSNLTYDQILGELKAIWIKLEDAGLVQPGMSFQTFCQIAQVKKQEAQMQDMLGGSFESILRNFMG